MHDQGPELAGTKKASARRTQTICLAAAGTTVAQLPLMQITDYLLIDAPESAK